MLEAVSGLAGVALLAFPFALVPALLGIRDRVEFLLAGAVAASAVVVLASIVLSLVHGLTRGWMLGLQALLAGTVFLAWRRAGGPSLPGLPTVRWTALREEAKEQPLVAVLVLAAAGALVLQAFMAVAVAPNNWDSMTYHLGRIAYWLQNDSALHYEGGTIRQLGSAPNGEFLQAWTILTTGTDRFASLVQWAALCGLAGSIFATGRALGFARSASLYAAALFVVLPQPIMQATSTQNDLIVCFFISAAILFALRGMARESLSELAVCATAVGLAIGAKGTTLIAAPALLLILVVMVRSRRPPSRLLVRFAALLAVATVGLGAFNYALNVDTFGSPFGDVQDQVERKSPIPENAVRVAWSFADAPGTPLPWLDLALGRPAGAVFGDLRSQSFPGFHLDSDVNEDGSSYGLFGLLVLGPWLAWVLLRRASAPIERALAAGAFAYVLMFMLFNEQNPWIGRVLMPGVVIGAPVLAGLQGRRLAGGAAAALALAGLVPSLLTNDRKPLLVPHGVPTVLERDRLGQQALPRPEMAGVIANLRRHVRREDAIGLVRNEDVWDYPFFGPQRARRVVPLERSQATSHRMRDEGLVGVVFADTEARPRGAVELAPRYWFLRAPRRHVRLRSGSR